MGRPIKTFVAARSLPTGRLWFSICVAWLLSLASALLLSPLAAAAVGSAGLVLVATLGFVPIRSAFAGEQRKITLLLNAVPEGILEVDAEGRIVFVNPQLCSLFGYQPEELLGQPVEMLVPPGARLAHPGHRAAFFTSERSRSMGSGLDIHGVRKDGRLIPVDISLSRLQMRGRTVMYCMVRDNSARKAFEQQLLDSNRKLTHGMAALERHSAELQTLTEMGELLHSSNSERELYDIVARTLERLFPDLSGAMYLLSGARHSADRAIGWGRQAPHLRMLATHADCWALRRGRAHSYLSLHDHPRCEHGSDGIVRTGCCVPLLGHGDLLGVLHLCADPGADAPELIKSRLQLLNAVANQVALSTANLRLRDKLMAQSHLDPLTGLANRRAIEEVFEQNVRYALLEHSDVAVLALDIDHFKSFNDRYGHDGGDVVLREVGRLLRQSLRHGDVICRMGGEEFAALLPNTSADEALVVAEKLRACVEALQVQREGRALGSITVSVGVASLEASSDTAATLLRRADRALYRAKAMGRNRIATCKPGDETGVHRIVPQLPRKA